VLMLASISHVCLMILHFPHSPCEMNEFSSECEEWEAENGPYVRGEFIIKSNPRTKGY